MRSLFTGTLPAFVAVFLLAPSTLISAEPRSANVAATPEELVRRALETELTGPSPRRKELLDEALAHDANFAPARWHRGFVKRGDSWANVDDASLDDPDNRVFLEYREQRNRMIGTAAEHRKMAAWCATTGLADESQLHWRKVLQFGEDPQALEALGLSANQGRPREPELPEDEQRKLAERRWAARTWEAPIKDWRDAILRGTKQEADHARAELRRLSDPNAVPALRKVFFQPTQKGPLAVLFVETVRQLPGPEATASLLQIATWHPSRHLRKLALDALKQRPKHAVVPMLLAAFVRPVESSTSVQLAPDGSMIRNHVVRLRGWSDDAIAHSQKQWTVIGKPDDRTRGEIARDVAADLQRIRLETAALAARAAQHNNRIQAVLAEIMEIDEPADPVGWLERWLRYSGYDVPDLPRETNYLSYVDAVYVVAPPEPPPRPEPAPLQLLPPFEPRLHSNSCFPAGTLVATLDGRRPIETIKPGDRVLSQDVDTGRLDYKLVHEVTLNPKSHMLRISLGSESITCTDGHYFWINGRGWMMAKELEAGMLLHGLCGAVAIDHVEPAGLKRSHNLVVGDYNTYFVGEQDVLAHDIMPPVEPTVVVPGLAATRP